MRNSHFVSLLVLLVLLCSSAALTIHNCINGKIDVYEDAPSPITCSDIANPADVVWRRGAGEVIGECKADGTCQPLYLYNDYSLKRAAYSSESHVTILRDFRGNGGLQLTCQQLGSTLSATCKIVVKHHAVLSQCKVETDSEHWTVTGLCHIEEAFSSDNDYSCRWTGPNNGVFGAFEDGTNRQKCSFTQPLPNREGVYTYLIYVSPPSTSSFSQDVRVVTPGNVSTSCPPTILVGRTLTCICRVTPPGSPSAVVKWEGRDSDLLSVNSVRREDNGTQYTCHVVWGGGIYSLFVYLVLVEDVAGESTSSKTSLLPYSPQPSLTSTPLTEGITDYPIMASSYQSDTPAPPIYFSGAIIGAVAAFVIFVFIVHFILIAVRRRRERLKAMRVVMEITETTAVER